MMLTYTTHKAHPVQKKNVAGTNRANALIDNRGYNSVQRKSVGVSVPQQKAEVLPAAVNTNVVQREKKKQVAATVGGAAALGLAGAYIGTALLPGLGTLGGALVGGIAGLVTGGVGGYVLSKPKLYQNQQKDNYKNELKNLREYQNDHRDAENAYQKGTIVKYSKSNSRKFVGLLQHGGVLYTYDENNQLSIGSGQGVMKHALVAGGKNVKAAGWARPQFSKAQENDRIYKEALLKIEELDHEANILRPKANRIMKHYQVQRHQIDTITNAKDRETAQNYVNVTGLLEHFIDQAEKLRQSQKDSSGIAKSSRIQLDNDSGHYAPKPNIKAEAFEGWRAAGFTNLIWKNWGK